MHTFYENIFFSIYSINVLSVSPEMIRVSWQLHDIKYWKISVNLSGV